MNTLKSLTIVAASLLLLLGAAHIASAQGIHDPAGSDKPLSPDIISRLGLGPADPRTQPPANTKPKLTAAQPHILSGSSAFSAAIFTTVGGRGATVDEATLFGDWDGKEDLTADRDKIVKNFAADPPIANHQLLRTAISEHTIANGFTENVFYYGDSVGNVFVAVDTTGDGVQDQVLQINLPTVLNAFGLLNSGSQIVITGIAINPVCDLTSWKNVNGSFAPFDGLIGEALYVSYFDPAGMRLTANNTLVKSGLLTFPIADIVSPAAAPPGILSATGFPVTVGGSFGVLFSTFANLGGIAVDDDGSVYFHQVDLQQFTGGNVVKLESVDKPGQGGFQDRSLATNGFATVSTLNPVNGLYQTISGPANQITRVTNYTGTSPLFGNIAALACGPNNVLYAALSRSHVATDDAAVQNTEGTFAAPAALGDTPSMVISFSDASGAFDKCSVLRQGLTLAATYPTQSAPQGVAVGNFNNDAFQDLAVTNFSSGSVSILLGAANGTFLPAVNYQVGTNPVAVIVGNFNANFNQDLAVVNAGSGNVSILIGAGDGTFGPAINTPVGTNPRAIASGLLDAGGVQDLVVANAGSGTVSVLLGVGDGTFTAGTPLTVGSNPMALALGNFNNALGLDLAVANSGDGTVSIFLGNNDGTFATTAGLAGLTNPSSIAVGDLVNDANNDLVIGDSGETTLRIYKGDGAGGFLLDSPFSTSGNVNALTLADLNGDGRLDVAMSETADSQVELILSVPGVPGGYTIPGVIPGINSPSGLAAANFQNGDALNDLAVADAAGSKVAILLSAPNGFIPIPDGFADVNIAGQVRTPGVNNFRAFVLGDGPDLRTAAAETLGVTTTDTLKLDMQIDYTVYSGLTVDEENKLYVISGGTPPGVGLNPSPDLGEILVFPDQNPYDRRADFIDLRGDTLPNPPASGGNVGDGDSDRFDHIFVQAPIDPFANQPTAFAGLSRGFLLYLNRTRNNAMKFAELPNGATQGDDDFDGPIGFEEFDPGHQVAGGDDQNFPFSGDDDGGAGSNPIPGPLNGGFEFTFGGVVSGVCTPTWNSFFLNSNGNVTFSAGDTDNIPSRDDLRTGLPRIAPAWGDLLPPARTSDKNTFPVQALGFAGINNFKVRWINVPVFGFDACDSKNTFSVSLFDDGTGIDENANQPLNPANPIGNNAVPFDLQEGPTALRFTLEPNTGVLIGAPPRRDGTGPFRFDYGRMDMLGSDGEPFLTGYSIGDQSASNPPAECDSDLGAAALAAESDLFRPGQIGRGTEPAIFEFFDQGKLPSLGPDGHIVNPIIAFDLRDEGNDPALTTPVGQTDPARSVLNFFGIACSPPPNPTISLVLPDSPVFAPGQPPLGPGLRGLLNVLGPQDVSLVGFDILPNEITQVCDGGTTARLGLAVTTTLTLTVDVNGDGVPETPLTLTNVMPVNKNLLRGTLVPLPASPGTVFPTLMGQGTGTFSSVASFTSGDNNKFGPFTRNAVSFADFGIRAPIVTSASLQTADPFTHMQTVAVAGLGFKLLNGTNKVTTIRAVDIDDHSFTVDSSSVNVTTTTLLTASFGFDLASSGRTFLIYALGPNGQSRNLTELPPGTDPSVPLGNEFGDIVTLTCGLGCSAAPILGVDRSGPLNFGSQDIDGGRTSGTVILLTNGGTLDLTFTGGEVALGGADPGDFAITDDTGENPLSPGDSRTVTVAFDPTSLGAKTADLIITSDDPHLTRIVQLTGTGTGIPLIAVTDGGISIPNGGVPVDVGHAEQGGPAIDVTFVVKNNGTGPLTTSTPTVPAGFTITEGLDASISPGGSDSFTVEVATGARGSFSGPISIANNSATNPFAFSVVATVLSAPLVEDFTEGGGNAHGWLGGAPPGFGGTVGVNSEGLCMHVPGPGSNLVLWVSPERLVELIDDTIYKVRLTLFTDQNLTDAIPLFFLTYDNFNTGGTGNNFGGFFWVLDVDGGAEGIGRPQGRTTYDFYLAPTAVEAPQWRTGAFTPQADLENDIRLQFDVNDANSTLLTDNDSGTICVSRLEVTAVPRSSLIVSSVVYNPPIATTTHFAEANNEIGVGGTGTINDTTHTVTYNLATTGNARKTLGPFDPAQSDLNKQLFPVVWTSDALYRTRVRIRAATSETDPIDVLFIASDTTTVELGMSQYVTRGGTGGAMDKVASPKLAAAEYEGYFYSQNATISLTPDASRLRPLAIFFNTANQGGDGTGGDTTIVESIEMDKITPFN